MIEIYDGWCITVDKNSYNVVKRVPYTDKKTGETKIRTEIFGYFGSVQAALEGLSRYLQKEELSERELTLSQAIVAIAESNARLRNAIMDAVPNMKVVAK